MHVIGWGERKPWYLESEDDGPYEAKSESWIAVNNVVGTHVLEVNPLFIEEC